METSLDKMIKILHLVNDVAQIYYLKFGEIKSKVLRIKKGPQKSNLKLSDLELRFVEKYKYVRYNQYNTNTI